ncbi:MAG: outer membrane protein assembly factor BamD [Spirochaetota bacterium]
MTYRKEWLVLAVGAFLLITGSSCLTNAPSKASDTLPSAIVEDRERALKVIQTPETVPVPIPHEEAPEISSDSEKPPGRAEAYRELITRTTLPEFDKPEAVGAEEATPPEREESIIVTENLPKPQYELEPLKKISETSVAPELSRPSDYQIPAHRSPFDLESQPPIPPPAQSSVTSSPIVQKITSQKMPEGENVKTKSINAQKGDTIGITMDRRGWLYLGESGGKDGIAFISRTIDSSSTAFIFKAEKRGQYRLLFQYQDMGKSTVENEQVIVSVLEKTESENVLAAQKTPAKEEKSESPVDYSIAERLFKDSRYQDALREYLRIYRENDPYLNNRIAELYVLLDKYINAEEYWFKNLNEDNAYRNLALRGLIKSSAKRKAEDIFDKYLNDFLRIREISIKDELAEAAEFQKGAGRLQTASTLLFEYLARYPDDKKIDWIYFSLGQIFEMESEIRDIRRSKEYYNKIINSYPTSMYWDKANERIMYLNRHFFQIH